MKRLIVLTIVLFVALGVFVINLPPREMTMKDLHPVIVPQPRREVIGIPDTSSSESRETAAIPIPADTFPNDPPKPSATFVEGKVTIEYYIIIESIRDRVLAEKKAQSLKQKYKTDIIVLPPAMEGNFRLSYGKYSSADEAKSVIKSVRKQICPDAWIYSSPPAVKTSNE
jgi:hypothetical protein